MTRSVSHQTLAIAVIAIGLLLRLAFATANAIWLDLPHQDEFYKVASELAVGEAQSRTGLAWTYSRLLGALFSITGPHEIVGFAASVLAWTAAALALDAMLKLLGAAPLARLAALLIFALTPSSIWFGSVIMRDVYQLLFVNLMALGALRIGIARDYEAAVPMVLAGVALCLLHGAFMVWGPLMALLVLAWVLVLHRPRPRSQVLVAFIVLAFVVFAAAMSLRFGYDVSDGLAEASNRYQSSLERRDSRTEFQTMAEIGRQGGLIGIAVGLFQYMLSPMPWRVQGLGDLGVLAENWLRLVYIGMALVALFIDRARRVPLLLLLFTYCCLEGLWSLGTVTWGTAIRHHLSASGLLLAAAFSSYRFGVGGALVRAGT